MHPKTVQQVNFDILYDVYCNAINKQQRDAKKIFYASTNSSRRKTLCK